MANWTELNWETWEFLNWQKPLVVAINWHNGASGDSSVFSCLRHRPRYNTTNIIPTTTTNSFSYYTHTHVISFWFFACALAFTFKKGSSVCSPEDCGVKSGSHSRFKFVHNRKTVDNKRGVASTNKSSSTALHCTDGMGKGEFKNRTRQCSAGMTTMIQERASERYS